MTKRGVIAAFVAFFILLLGVVPAGAEESPSSTSATAKDKAPVKEAAKSEAKAESKDKAPVKEAAKAEAKAESKDKAPVKEAVEAKAPARETKSSECPPRPTPTPTASKTATPTTPPPTSPQPPAEVEYSAWLDVSWDCETHLVTRTRTRAETPYVWNGSGWVLDRANTRYTEEIGTRPMTSSELLDCGPPLPPSPTPTPTPEPTPTPDPTPSPTPTPTPEPTPTPDPTPSPTPTVTPSLNSARPGLPKTGN